MRIIFLLFFVCDVSIAKGNFHFGDYVHVDKTPSSFYENCWGTIVERTGDNYKIEYPVCNGRTVPEIWSVRGKDLTMSPRPQ